MAKETKSKITDSGLKKALKKAKESDVDKLADEKLAGVSGGEEGNNPRCRRCGSTRTCWNHWAFFYFCCDCGYIF